jgi:hypothetical protein
VKSSSSSHTVLIFKGILLFVGLHSITLGTVIYFFTDFFYKIFFGVQVENLFFVRQSGIFLFLAGLFYLFPLLDVGKFHQLVLVVFVSKVMAVIFLLTNARYTPSPAMINLAAMGDATMAMALMAIYTTCMKKSFFQFSGSGKNKA